MTHIGRRQFVYTATAIVGTVAGLKLQPEPVQYRILDWALYDTAMYPGGGQLRPLVVSPGVYRQLKDDPELRKYILGK